MLKKNASVEISNAIGFPGVCKSTVDGMAGENPEVQDARHSVLKDNT